MVLTKETWILELKALYAGSPRLVLLTCLRETDRYFVPGFPSQFKASKPFGTLPPNLAAP